MTINPRFAGPKSVLEFPKKRISGFCGGVSGRRYYSPSLGRFINRDPTEERGGLSLYAFCLNNPINKWDLLGNSWASSCDANGDLRFYDVCDDYAPPSGPQGYIDFYSNSLNSLDNLFAGFDARDNQQRQQQQQQVIDYVSAGQTAMGSALESTTQGLVSAQISATYDAHVESTYAAFTDNLASAQPAQLAAQLAAFQTSADNNIVSQVTSGCNSLAVSSTGANNQSGSSSWTFSLANVGPNLKTVFCTGPARIMGTACEIVDEASQWFNRNVFSTDLLVAAQPELMALKLPALADIALQSQKVVRSEQTGYVIAKGVEAYTTVVTDEGKLRNLPDYRVMPPPEPAEVLVVPPTAKPYKYQEFKGKFN